MVLFCSALAALPPQKQLGTVLRPIGGQFCGSCIAVPNPGGLQFGRLISLKCKAMANGTISNQNHRIRANPARRWLIGRCQSYVKQRSTENCSPVFNIWKQARQLVRHRLDCNDAIPFGFFALIKLACFLAKPNCIVGSFDVGPC